MSLCTLSVAFILFGSLFIYPSLGAQPDLVVSISSNGDDRSPIEFFAKRAQFGSRPRLFEGSLVRPPGYDFFLCERFRTNLEMNENGQVSVITLPPYKKPGEENSTVMLVPRGECSFERKAFAAKHFYGAKAILIYDRLGARYSFNEKTNRVIFPQAVLDYECGNGVSAMFDLPLDPPAYDEKILDPVMGLKTKMPTKPTSMVTTTTNDEELVPGEESSLVSWVGACDLAGTARNPCDSQLCLVTSHLVNSTDYPVCCAWDTHVTMPFADDAKDLNTDDILAAWVTIRQSELIFGTDILSSGAEVSITRRGNGSAFNLSYVFMWMWGTLVMLVGAWYSTGEYRRFHAKLTAYKESEEGREDNNRRERRKKAGQPTVHPTGESAGPTRLGIISRNESDSGSGSQSFHIEMDGSIVENSAQTTDRNKPKKGKKSKAEKKDEVWSLHSLPPPERKRKKKRSLHTTNRQLDNNANANANANANESNTEDEAGNGSSSIPARDSGTIKPFEMTQYHVIGLVVMTSATLILLYFYPKAYTVIFIGYGILCGSAASYLIIDPLINFAIPKLGKNWVEEFNIPVICGCNGFSVTSYLITFTWVGVWIWYGITHYRPQTNAFFWITLNILGACVCILCAAVLKITSIKIATLLLVAIFVYDVFFVFITPFLTGGVSVMLRVASGGENPNGDDFCYKYPDDSFCKGIGFLPMLFILPKTNDYANGSVILGLGDIILPGFLIAFCARLDEAARLLGAHAPFPDIAIPKKWYEGYFFPMMVSYSFGLFCAYLVVILTEQGQPALLYICPICLGTLFIVGRKEIKELWNGSKVLKLADGLISKFERKWGKARMKEFAERLRRQNAEQAPGAENEIGQEEPTTGRRSKKNRAENPTTRSSPSNNMEPRPKDVCFGNEDHPGTKAFRRAVEEVADDLGEEEYRPEIYKMIRKKLKGRRFFMRSNIVWAEASKLETRKQIGRAYDRARGRHSKVLKSSNSLSEVSIL